MTKRSCNVLFCFSLAFGFSVFLSTIQYGFCESSVQSMQSLDSAQSHNSPYDWAIFGGLGGGYGLISGPGYSNTPQGEQLLVNGAVSLQLRKWIFDGGLGWFYSKERGQASSVESVQISTRAGLAEFSPRYKLSDRWQLGPVINLAFGTDTGFGSTVGPSTASWFGGVKGVYEISASRFPVRFWSQLSTDLVTPNQRVVLALVGVEIGIPVGGSKRENHDTTVTSFEKDPEGETVRVTLDPQRIFFGTSSASLKNDVNVVLKDVGNYLNKNEPPTQVEIAGHADQRGRFEYNLALSKKRADAVRKAILKGGVSPDQLQIQANSYLHLLDPANTQEAWAKNRRVEITFSKIKNPDLLREKLRPLTVEHPVN